MVSMDMSNEDHPCFDDNLVNLGFLASKVIVKLAVRPLRRVHEYPTCTSKVIHRRGTPILRRFHAWSAKEHNLRVIWLKQLMDYWFLNEV